MSPTRAALKHLDLTDRRLRRVVYAFLALVLVLVVVVGAVMVALLLQESEQRSLLRKDVLAAEVRGAITDRDTLEHKVNSTLQHHQQCLDLAFLASARIEQESKELVERCNARLRDNPATPQNESLEHKQQVLEEANREVERLLERLDEAEERE